MSAPVIPFVHWPAVQAMVGADIPYSEIPRDPMSYLQEVHTHIGQNGYPPVKIVTMGVVRFIERHRSMKKEAEFKVAIKKIADQQEESNVKYERLVVQYEQLLASYNAMKKAYEAETENTRALKKQLDEILGMLNSCGEHDC